MLKCFANKMLNVRGIRKAELLQTIMDIVHTFHVFDDTVVLHTTVRPEKIVATPNNAIIYEHVHIFLCPLEHLFILLIKAFLVNMNTFHSKRISFYIKM